MSNQIGKMIYLIILKSDLRFDFFIHDDEFRIFSIPSSQVYKTNEVVDRIKLENTMERNIDLLDHRRPIERTGTLMIPVASNWSTNYHSIYIRNLTHKNTRIPKEIILIDSDESDQEIPQTPKNVTIQNLDICINIPKTHRKLCKICNIHTINTVCVPCGHLNFCGFCVAKDLKISIRNKIPKNHVIRPCPMCQMRYKRIYVVNLDD